MHLLITGAHGFIAQHYLAHLFNPSHSLIRSDFLSDLPEQVFAISSGLHAEPSMLITREYSWEALEQISIPATHYLHLAGLAHDLRHPSREQTQAYFQVNQGLTERLFDHFIASPSARVFVYVSSIHAVNDTRASEVPLTEETLTEPQRPYGTSKLAAEEYIRTHLSEVEALGKRVYILRPSLVLAPDAKGNIRRLARLVKLGLPWPFANLNPPCSVCSLTTLFATFNSALTGKLPEGTYHVCDSRPSSSVALLQYLARELQRPSPRLIRIPVLCLRLLAKMGSLLHLPYNKATFTTLSSPRISSNCKLCEALGVSSMPADLCSAGA